MVLKIGALVKKTRENNSTLRHWTKEGLLDAIETTEAGYQLYSVKMVELILQIKQIDACGFIG